MKWSLFITGLCVLMLCCQSQGDEGGTANGEQKKVFYLNSYHEGYKPSDDIRAGFDSKIMDSIEVNTFYLDSKRLTEDEVSARADSAVKLIRNYSPDVIVTSDDNAVKYVIEPYFKEGPYPVIFTGVNWQCSQYGLPTDYVTGILEVLPVQATVDTLRNYYPDLHEVAILSENSTSEQKNMETFSNLFKEMDIQLRYRLVEEFEDWKAAFQELNDSVDMIFLPTNGSIRNWDRQKATAWVEEHLQVPVATCDDFMMQYAVFGLTKRPVEMGEWAGRQVLNILQGKEVSSITVTENHTYEAWINPALAERLEFTPGNSLSEEIKKFKTPEELIP